MEKMMDTTKRFSNRVENYTKFRPSYPAELIDWLLTRFGISKKSKIADVGSGTGLFSALLLPEVQAVFAVEPNAEMRLEAENRLKQSKTFISIDGTSEKTTLDSDSIDFITVAQAFHWFNPENTKKEFKRILKHDGAVFIIWNKRLVNTPFLDCYERTLQTEIAEYKKVNHNNVSLENIKSFLEKDFEFRQFDNNQVFDWGGLIGRLNSSSYAPERETKEYKIIEEQLRWAYEKYSESGLIQFNYKTEVYSGKFV